MSAIKKIVTRQDLIEAVDQLLEYNWADEEEDFERMEEENGKGKNDHHIFITMQALDQWARRQRVKGVRIR